jgi:hypothetical protein
MRRAFASAAAVSGVTACLALGLPARAEPSDPAPASSSQTAAADPQARLAEATAKLEDLFADQFVRGTIDRAALASAMDEAVQAFAESARAKVLEHIDDVLESAQQVASQLSPEERADAVATPEQLGETEDALVRGWGWRRARGFGGLGAFAFPGMYRFARPFHRYRGHGVHGFACGLNGTACGLGRGGWFW